jgi:hypothetical protein
MQNLPAHLANRQRRDLATSAMGGINAGSGPHISIKDNRFTLVDAAGNEKQMQTLYLDVCIIDANPTVSKIFYDPNKKYDPSGADNSAPICFSDNGVGASAQAAQPQNTNCQLCPWNAWGSATSQMTGKQTKACNDGKKLAVLVPNQGVDGMVFLLRVPPATLKNLAKYTQSVGGHGVDLPDVATRIEFESQGVLKFTPTGYVDELTAQATEKIWANKGTEQMVGKLDRVWNGAADAAKVAYAQNAAIAPPAQPIAPAPAPAPAFAPPPQPFMNQQNAAAPPFGGPQVGFGGAPAPAAPFANQAPPAPPFQTPGPASSPFGQPPTQEPFAAPAFAPAPQEPPKVRKPRTPKAPAAAPAADDGIPPFLQRNADETPPVVEAAPQPTFGMNPTPPAPSPDMAAALDAAFRLPT